jgi:hypothetical protein
MTSRQSGGRDHRQLPRTPYFQTSNVQSGSTLSNRSAMTIFARLRSVHLQSLHACTKYLLDMSRTGRFLASLMRFTGERNMIGSGRVMTARFYPMKKVEVAAGTAEGWKPDYPTGTTADTPVAPAASVGRQSTECAQEDSRTSANRWQHAEVRRNQRS